MLRYIISVTCVCLFTMTCLNGQSFIRYKMNDGMYNGFYTSAVDSVVHVTENGAVVQKVYSGEMVKTIPVDDIIEISFEGASLNSEQDAGEYKILELDVEEGFKKVYVDNRATLIASKTGDFSNDTILVASAYNNLKFLFFTDNEGRVTRYFDGENQIIFDVDDEAYILPGFSDSSTRTTRGIGKAIWESLKIALNNKGIQAYLKLTEISADYIVENLHAVANDPELHSQRCIVAALSLAGAMIDPVAYVSSILAMLNYSDDNPAKLFDDFYGGIIGSMSDLLNEMCPDYETMQKYAEFYANKYNIHLSPNTPTDITATSARLNGSIYTEDGLRGNLYFHVSEIGTLEEDIYVPAANEHSRVNEWEVNATISNLKPDTWYMAELVYEVTVDKLKLRISESIDFDTLELIASAGHAYDITCTSAVIDCKYTNAGDHWRGLRYYTEETDNAPSQKGVISADLKESVSITLTDLLPDTKYYYYAIVDYGEGEVVSELKEFTTDSIDLTLKSISYDDDYYYSDGYVVYNLTAKISGKTDDIGEFHSCGIYLWDSAKNESRIWYEGLSGTYNNTPINMFIGVSESGFDKRDDSRYYAESTKTYFGIYVQFNDGSYYMSEPVQCKFIYDRKPTFRYTSVGPISVSVAGSEVNEDGETIIHYHAEHACSYFYEGVFWIDSIQRWCEGGSWQFPSTGEKYDEPWTPSYDMDDAYDSSAGFYYWSTTDDISLSVWNVITTKSGEKLSSNSLVYGGSPENPTVSIGGTRSSYSTRMAKSSNDNEFNNSFLGIINIESDAHSNYTKESQVRRIEDLEILCK